MKKIAILGSTGSIGTQTLEIVRTNGDLEVVALAAGNNIDLLEKQIREFRPKLAAVWKEERAAELKSRLGDMDVRVVYGMDGLLEVAAVPESEILGDGDRRDDRYPPHDRSHTGGKRYCPCEQGDPGHSRTYHHASGKRLRRVHSSGGQ